MEHLVCKKRQGLHLPALGTLLQLFSKGSSEEMDSILDQWGLESLRPFMDKKDDPEQEDHPEKEEHNPESRNLVNLVVH